jgi:hypothetical protein
MAVPIPPAAFDHSWGYGDYMTVIDDWKDYGIFIGERVAAHNGAPEAPAAEPKDGDVFCYYKTYEGSDPLQGIFGDDPTAGIRKVFFKGTTGEYGFADIFNLWQIQVALDLMSNDFAHPESRFVAKPDATGIPKNTVGYAFKYSNPGWEIRRVTVRFSGKPSVDPDPDGFIPKWVWPGPKGWKRVFQRWIFRSDMPGLPGQRAVMKYRADSAVSPSTLKEHSRDLNWDTDSATWQAIFEAKGIPKHNVFDINSALPILPPVTAALIQESIDNSGLIFECVSYGHWKLAGTYKTGVQYDDNGYIFADDVVIYGWDDPHDYDWLRNSTRGGIHDGDIITPDIPNDMRAAAKQLTIVYAERHSYANNEYEQYRQFKVDYSKNSNRAAYGYWMFAPHFTWDEHGDGGEISSGAYYQSVFQPNANPPPNVIKVPGFNSSGGQRFISFDGEDDAKSEEKTASLWGSNTPDEFGPSWLGYFQYAFGAFHTFRGETRIDEPFLTGDGVHSNSRESTQPPYAYRVVGSAIKLRSHPAVFGAGLIRGTKIVTMFGYTVPGGSNYNDNSGEGWNCGDSVEVVSANGQNFKLTSLGSITVRGDVGWGKIIGSEALPALRYNVSDDVLAYGITYKDETTQAVLSARDRIEQNSNGYQFEWAAGLVDFSAAYTKK